MRRASATSTRPDLREPLYGPALARTVAEFDPYEAIRSAYERAPAEHPIDKMLYADNQIRLPDHSVMILDRTAMARTASKRAARSWTTRSPSSPRGCRPGSRCAGARSATSSSVCASATPARCWPARSRASHRRCPICRATSIGDWPTAFSRTLPAGTASCASRGSIGCRARRRQGRPRQPAVAAGQQRGVAPDGIRPVPSRAGGADRRDREDGRLMAEERLTRYSMLRSPYQSAVRRRPSLIRTLGSKPSTRRALATRRTCSS